MWNDDRQLGCLLRAGRLKEGMSQEAAAEQLGIDVRTWRRYENGESSIPANVLFYFWPEMQKILENHFLERSCSGNCEKCKEKRRRVKRSQNVQQGATFGPKDDRKPSL